MDKDTIDKLAGFVDELDVTMELVVDSDDAYFFNKLGEEVGEAHEVFSALLGSSGKVRKLTKKSGSVEAALEEELSDSFVVLMIIARRHGLTIDNILETGMIKMRQKNIKRRKTNAR